MEVKGTRTLIVGSTSAFVHTIGASVSWEVRFVLFSLFYVLLRRVVRLIAGSSNDELSTEVEVLVLRHQSEGPQAPGRQAASSPSRPLVHGGDQQGPSSCSVVLVPGQPTDAPSVAPGAREAEVDLRAEVGRRQATDPR
jgi:hypothetical protein